MDLTGWRRSESDKGPIHVTIQGKLADRIRALHRISIEGTSCGGRTSIEQWVVEVVDSFVVEHRSNKLRLDASRHDDRNGSDFNGTELGMD